MEELQNNWLKILMFKQRLLTTLALVPLVLMAIYYASPSVLIGLMGVLIALLSWEWLSLIPMHSTVLQGGRSLASLGTTYRVLGTTYRVLGMMYKVLFVCLTLGLIWPAIYWLELWLKADLLFWGLILLAVATFPKSQTIWGFPVAVSFACLFLLPLLASASRALYYQPHGQDLIVYLLCLVWAADIGAYLAGKQWGRHKLIPAVSPGKTLEGVLGGLALVLFVSGVGYFYFKPKYGFIWIITAIMIALISILGDLFISMLKRRVNVKDTGYIIPGHGGVLDRLDSLIAALPWFYGLYPFSGVS